MSGIPFALSPLKVPYKSRFWYYKLLRERWFDRSDYIETRDIRSELTTNGYGCFHDTECAYVSRVLPVDNLVLE